MNVPGGQYGGSSGLERAAGWAGGGPEDSPARTASSRASASGDPTSPARGRALGTAAGTAVRPARAGDGSAVAGLAVAGDRRGRRRCGDRPEIAAQGVGADRDAPPAQEFRQGRGRLMAAHHRVEQRLAQPLDQVPLGIGARGVRGARRGRGDRQAGEFAGDAGEIHGVGRIPGFWFVGGGTLHVNPAHPSEAPDRTGPR